MMRDLDGQPLLPLDIVAVIQKDGSRVKVTIGQIEVLDIGRGVVGVRRISQNGRACSSYWISVGLKEAKPSECLKVIDQRN